MRPRKDTPTAQKKGKNTARRCQSSRPERRAAARLARAPGIIAPYSWPKLPRMPQPMERERATQRTDGTPGAGSRVARVVSPGAAIWGSPMGGLITATLVKGATWRNRNGEAKELTRVRVGFIRSNTLYQRASL